MASMVGGWCMADVRFPDLQKKKGGVHVIERLPDKPAVEVTLQLPIINKNK